MLTTLVLAAGESKRFVGYPMPKQFITFAMNSSEQLLQMWENAISSVMTPCRRYVAVRTTARQHYKPLTPASMVVVPVTTGQATTLQAALKAFDELGNLGEELLVVNCDQGFAPGLLDRLVNVGRTEQLPAAVTFPAAPEECNRWSYVDGHPVFYEAAEKRAIGTHALAGAYYFPDRRTLAESLDEAIDWTAGTGWEPYVSHLYQFLLAPKISVECRREDLYDWGTPEALNAFLWSNRL